MLMLRSASRALVFSLAGLAGLAGCSTKSGHSAQASTRKDPAAARQLIAAGAAVIDVRTAEEFADGRLDRATNIPVQELATRMAEVDALVGNDKSRPVVLYCQSGRRATTAKQQLEAAGYTNVVNGGGLDDVQ
jgi:phage shock protein E